MILPQVSTTSFRVLILGLLLATTLQAMVVALVTLWKPYMTKFMALSVVTWVIPSLLVIDLVLMSSWIISDLSFFQDLILFSSFIIATLTACSPFGRRSTREYGFHKVLPYRGDLGPSHQIPQ